ncbi:DUF2800 domain-containing protein [bacterium D16-76]|nr:DUF2800 domain-containing protein [bacterium D16-76]
MSAHSIFSPSASHRVLNCPPSLMLCARVADQSSPYATEGTSAHELCAFLVEKALGRKVKNPTENLDYYNAEMQSCAEGYASFVMEEYEKAKAVCPDAEVMVEQRVDISRWVPGCGGTADCIILSDGAVEVVDYKQGVGVPVSATSEEFGGNPQLMCYCLGVLEMFGVPVEKHGVNAHLRQKGKVAELALGYGGSVGALKAMGALEMGLSEEELLPLVTSWREANPHVTRFWWDVDAAVKKAVMYKTSVGSHGFRFYFQSGMLFIDLPSGRRLSYVKPRIGVNRFGSENVTYEGINLGKWTRLETYGPKVTENLVQAVSRDILAYAMKTLRHCFIVSSVHDELIIECSPDVSLQAVCDQMGRTPPWLPDIELRADGYECQFYKKE